MGTEICLYSNSDRDQHTILVGRDLNAAFCEMNHTLHRNLAEFRRMTLKVLESRRTSRTEKTRHELILRDLALLVKDMDSGGHQVIMKALPLEWHLRRSALVLVWMAEIALATAESFEMVRRTPKCIQQMAKGMAAKLVHQCKDWNVQPYGTQYHALRVARELQN